MTRSQENFDGSATVARPRSGAKAPLDAATRRTRRWVAALTLTLTLAATIGYVAVISTGAGANVAELISVPLFSLLFGWIVFSFTLATLGFVCLAKRPASDNDHASVPGGDPLSDVTQTAVLMPVYNESPERVFAAIAAMIESLRVIGDAQRFDFFVLSDTTNHEVWLQEELAWQRLTQSIGEHGRVFYRHRPKNTSRKAGNIADFVTRWGDQYRYMIVLDADSLIDATTMHAMVARMDADDHLGILQVPPVPIGRTSLFARLQQFAASVYGPIFVAGFARWASDESNYWGHNAIIRVEPFRAHCDLPVLPGKAPLGGEILSHDFVEAALMLRAGWKVQLATDLGGSYEECPTTLADYAQRDQRWCQGNLQHSKLLISENFRPLSRMHFGCGVMSYVASPIWVLFTLFCMAGTGWEFYRGAAAASSPPDDLLPGALILFIVSMALLLLPKLWSVILVTSDRRQRRAHGGVTAVCLSAVVEVIASVLLSPIMAVYHTRFVLAALRGTNVQWSAQQRGERGVRWSDAARQFGTWTLIATLVAAVLAAIAPPLLLWFSPLLAGLVLAVPIAVAMGSQQLGLWARRLGLLAIPQEHRPPALCQHHSQLLAETPSWQPTTAAPTLLAAFIQDPRLFLLHTQIQRSNGTDVRLPINEAKAIEAAYASGGATKIPKESQTALLNDPQTLRALHLEAIGAQEELAS